MPLGDDAAFADTARIFAETGHIAYTGWASMVQSWQIVWGALFVRLFGYSAGPLDASTMLVGLLTIFLWHGVLLRFRVSRRGAFLGALMIGCSPLYVVVDASYLTDVHGLLAIVLCLAMCQKAVSARSEKATVLWLAAASVANLGVGSVRQICWLGALVMVPATGWLLRKRRGAFATGVATAVLSVVAVWLTLRWFSAQPYTYPEKLIAGPIGKQELIHFSTQWMGMILLSVVALLPVSLAWASRLPELGKAAWLRLAGVLGLASAVMVVLSHKPAMLGKAVFPWIEPVFEVYGLPRIVPGIAMPAALTLGERVVLSVLIAGLGWVLVEQAWLLLRERQSDGGIGLETRTMWWILGPYTLIYAAALCGRAMFVSLQDRYLLLLMPSLAIFGIRVYEKRWGRSLPWGSMAAVVLLAGYAVAGQHTLNARALAADRLDKRLQSMGIARGEVSEGFNRDLWEQVSYGGHMNNYRVVNPPNGFDVRVPHWNLPMGCEINYDVFVSKIRPRYFFSDRADPICFVPAGIRPEPYVGWLPPFQRELQVMQAAPRKR